MSDIQISKHNFEVAKTRIKELLDKVPEKADLPKLKTSYFFGFIDRSVTGAEMNDITKSINNSFQNYNTQIITIKKEFVEIYNALETLDKEYIQGIIIATNEAKEASKQAEAASVQAEKNSLQAERISLQAEKNSKQAGEISLQAKKAWDKAKEALDEALIAQADIKKIIEALKISISKLQETKIETDRKLSLLEKRLEEVESIKILEESIQKSLLDIEQKISRLEKYKSELEEYEHLKDVDNIWESIQKHQEHLDSLNTQLSQTKIDLTKLDNITAKSFQETYSKINSKSELFEKRIRIAYWVAGGALFFSLLQFVLLMLKVL